MDIKSIKTTDLKPYKNNPRKNEIYRRIWI